jgi:hypothetical protein
LVEALQDPERSIPDVAGRDSVGEHPVQDASWARAIGQAKSAFMPPRELRGETVPLNHLPAI